MIIYVRNVQNITERDKLEMAVSYNKLWKLLIDKKMSNADLRKTADLAPNTMTKLRRDEPVAMIVLEKICAVLDADFGDIMTYVPDQEDCEE